MNRDKARKLSDTGQSEWVETEKKQGHHKLAPALADELRTRAAAH